MKSQLLPDALFPGLVATHPASTTLREQHGLAVIGYFSSANHPHKAQNREAHHGTPQEDHSYVHYFQHYMPSANNGNISLFRDRVKLHRFRIGFVPGLSTVLVIPDGRALIEVVL